LSDKLRLAIDALAPRLRRFGVALTGSVADADDLVRHARARALSRHTELHRQLHLATWLFGIMHDVWVEVSRLGRWSSRAAAAAADDADLLDQAQPGLASVRRALADLPADQRALLTLVCVEGLSYHRVATVLDLPLGTVMSQLARARLALHERIAAQAATPTSNALAEDGVRSETTEGVTP
jgi:RNA polymerase sigma-70 factor (ECF subfamily)